MKKAKVQQAWSFGKRAFLEEGQGESKTGRKSQSEESWRLHFNLKVLPIEERSGEESWIWITQSQLTSIRWLSQLLSFDLFKVFSFHFFKDNGI